MPLGYDANERTLVINPAEAETVRRVFALYRELGCVRRVKEAADRLGLRTKCSTTTNGTERGGKPFSRGHLYTLLSNPIYTGQIAHKGELHSGQQAALIDDESWSAVRDQLAANTSDHRRKAKAAEPSLLAGLLVDARGERLTPSHAVKKGRRYRYYVSAALITDAGADRAQGWRLAAREIEEAVIRILADALTSPAGLVERFSAAGMPSDQIRKLLSRAARVKAALARISQRGGCIGTLDLRKSCCENGLSRRQGSPMQTECSADLFGFAPVEGRKVVAAFDGGRMTSEAGALLLGATDGQLRLVERFAGCFTDCRAAELVEHTVARLVGQRVFGMALGYEDLIDHDQLRHDPVMAVLGGKLSAKRADCAPLAGKSTLNRLELSRPEPTRYHKISYDAAAIERLFVDLFLDAHSSAPPQITLDLDATDDPLHGQQEERFFHGYYDGYCYLPLYVFCGRHLLAAKLRPANIDASAGSVEETARIVAQIRQHWPKVRILLRADSGFAREALMAWCETNGVDFLFGLAKNSRLIGEIETELAAAQEHSQRTGKSARRFRDFIWQTRQSWSRERRVVAKAEWTGGEANPRFVVTSLAREEHEARHLYEKLYCARGEMENRIKECQLDLYADRTSAHTMRANQLRLWFAAMAYVLISALRRIGLTHTQFARASCGTIRLKLLKIGALVRTSVRRIKLAMPSAFPYQAEYRAAHAALTAAAR